MTEHAPKQIELAMQTSFADDRWHVTVQAWIGTQAAADAMIKILETVRPLLPTEEGMTNADDER